MNRDDVDAFLAELIAEHMTGLRVELLQHVERLIASKPLPPFVPPAPWDARGVLHPAGVVVRHRNGLFSARRDTTEEPPSDAWLPLVVGLAGLDLRWSDSDRVFVCIAQLSDGRTVEHKAEIAVPIVRGYWQPEIMYYPGDRVFRYGEHHCRKACMGLDPNKPEHAEHWEKVGGKYARDVVFVLDDETGELSENGRTVGNVRKVFEGVVARAFAKQAA